MAPSDRRRWIPATASIVMLFPGVHRDLLPEKSDLETYLGAKLSPVPPASGFTSLAALMTPTGLGVRLELTSVPDPVTRVQTRHEVPEVSDLQAMAAFAEWLLKRPTPKPSTVGINFARVFIASAEQPTKAFLESVAQESSLASIIGGRKARIGQVIAISSPASDVQAQLKLVDVRGESLTTEFQGLVAEMNYTMPTPTKADMRRRVRASEILARFSDFNKSMERLAAKVAKHGE